MDCQIAICASDPALLSALRFSLSLEGFDVCDDSEPASTAACVIIDQDFEGDGLGWLGRLRASGSQVPAMFLVTHPDRALRASAAAFDARIIHKPLTGDELTEGLASILSH